MRVHKIRLQEKSAGKIKTTRADESAISATVLRDLFKIKVGAFFVFFHSSVEKHNLLSLNEIKGQIIRSLKCLIK